MNGEASDRRRPDGLWRSRGYGWLLEVGPHGFSVSDLTEVSNQRVDQGPAGGFDQAFEQVQPPGAPGLWLRQRGDVTVYAFDPADPTSLPPATALDPDPVRSFEVMWREFQRHYAFFGLRGVDWDEAYRRLRPRLDGSSDAAALWDLSAELLGPLRDAHVTVSDGRRALDVTSPIRERKLALQRAFGVPAWSADRQAYTDGVGRALGELALGGRQRRTANGVMLYGEIEPDIGYIAILGEFGHADTDRSRAALDLPRPRLAAADFLADEIAGMRRGLDEIVAALSGMKALIVDARLNYGGYDRLALDFAARFADRPRTAYRKKTWEDGGVVFDQAIEVTPAAPSLAGVPVWLLTSRQTASAGEILTLALSACPNVVRVGEATLGILSDNLYKRLPNGWEISLSNEIYESPDGVVWEALGIPPQIEVPVFEPADVRSGFRRAIDAALVQARQALARSATP